MNTKLKKVGEKLIRFDVQLSYPHAVCNECGDECQVTRVFIPVKTIVKEPDFDVYMEFEELDGSPCCESEVTLYNAFEQEHPNPYWKPEPLNMESA